MTNTAAKLDRLKKQKTGYSTAELDQRGWSRYAEICDALERNHHGDYVMIEVDSGDYFVGTTPDEALRQAEAAHPGRAFCLIRVGHQAAHKMKRQ